MGKTVAVVDYGMGNLRSVSQAVMHVAQGSGFEVLVTADPDVVYAAERVVLPGQGAMPDCMRELRDSGLKEAVLDAAARKPSGELATTSPGRRSRSVSDSSVCPASRRSAAKSNCTSVSSGARPAARRE